MGEHMQIGGSDEGRERGLTVCRTGEHAGQEAACDGRRGMVEVRTRCPARYIC